MIDPDDSAIATVSQFHHPTAKHQGSTTHWCVPSSLRTGWSHLPQRVPWCRLDQMGRWLHAAAGCICLDLLWLGVSMAMGVPPNRWFLMEHPIVGWMMTGGTPISGNLESCCCGTLIYADLQGFFFETASGQLLEYVGITCRRLWMSAPPK